MNDGLFVLAFSPSIVAKLVEPKVIAGVIKVPPVLTVIFGATTVPEKVEVVLLRLRA